jgi:hypothetical protein
LGAKAVRNLFDAGADAFLASPEAQMIQSLTIFGNRAQYFVA